MGYQAFYYTTGTPGVDLVDRFVYTIDCRVQTVRIDTEYTCMNIKYRYVNDSFLYAFSKMCSFLIDSVLAANG